MEKDRIPRHQTAPLLLLLCRRPMDPHRSSQPRQCGGAQPRRLCEYVDGVVSRLEEMSLRGDDPELSDDELGLNDQLQQDEVLAPEAVYGENVFIADGKRGLRSFQINIQNEFANDFTVSAKLRASHEHLKAGVIGHEVDDSDEFMYTFKVRYLPPIVLTCLLPQSYPSHHPPYFMVCVQWLDSKKISDLCLHARYRLDGTTWAGGHL